MAFDQFTRRHFFFGTLLAGAVPVGGFGSTPSLKALGYKSPNEKLNIASIGAGGKAASDIRGCAPTENDRGGRHECEQDALPARPGPVPEERIEERPDEQHSGQNQV